MCISSTIKKPYLLSHKRCRFAASNHTITLPGMHYYNPMIIYNWLSDVVIVFRKYFYGYSLNLNQSNFHWLNQWKKYFSPSNQSIFTEIVSEIWLIYSKLFLAISISQFSLIISRFWLIHQWKKYFSLSNQSIFTEIISEIWLIYSNLFLAIWISQISLIISRFRLIQI